MNQYELILFRVTVNYDKNAFTSKTKMRDVVIFANRTTFCKVEKVIKY